MKLLFMVHFLTCSSWWHTCWCHGLTMQYLVLPHTIYEHDLCSLFYLLWRNGRQQRAYRGADLSHSIPESGGKSNKEITVITGISFHAIQHWTKKTNGGGDEGPSLHKKRSVRQHICSQGDHEDSPTSCVQRTTSCCKGTQGAYNLSKNIFTRTIQHSSITILASNIVPHEESRH